MEQIDRQFSIKSWFDQTYRDRGMSYLRPAEAYPIFLQMLDAEPGQRLLDVGCGPGLLLGAALDRGLMATGVDISEVAIDMAKERIPEADLHVANAEALPFPDDAFDLITCVGALERFLDRPAALAELARVAVADARLCIMVRNASALEWRVWRRLLGRQNHTGHQDADTLQAWRRLFESSGFTIETTYMDQWNRQKLRRVARGFRAWDPRQPEPIAEPLFGWMFAYELIFILRLAP